MPDPNLYSAIEAERQTEREEVQAIHELREHLAAANSPEQALEILLQTLDTCCGELRAHTKAACGVDLWTGEGEWNRLSDRQKHVVDGNAKGFAAYCVILNGALEARSLGALPADVCSMVLKQLARQPKRISIRNYQASEIPDDIRNNAQIHIAAYVEQMLQPHGKKQGTAQTINGNLQAFLNVAGREGLHDAAVQAIEEPLETAEPIECVNATARYVRSEYGDKVHLNPQALLDTEEDPKNVETQVINSAEIKQALARLKPKEQQAIEEKAEGLTDQERADKHGISLSEAKERVRRARAKCKA